MASLATSLSPAVAVDHPYPVFDNPRKQIRSESLKVVRGAQTVLVPGVKLRVMAAGKVQGEGKVDDKPTSVSATYVVNGLDKAFLENLAAALEADFIARLKSKGFIVLTYGDVKNDPEMKALIRLDKPANASFPTETQGQDITIVAAPTPDQNLKPSFQGSVWPLRKAARARDAVVMLPSYAVLAPQFWIEKMESDLSNYVVARNAPGMTVIPDGFRVDLINPRSDMGFLGNTEMYVTLENAAGTLTRVGDKHSTSYRFDVRPDNYRAGVLSAAKAFNEAATTLLSEESLK